MKLRGIVDSKGRHAAYKERLERDAAHAAALAAPPTAERQHNAETLPDGTIRCCGAIYAKHAHAAHLRGEAVHEWASGIGIVAADRAGLK